MAHIIVCANVTENQQKCKGWKDFFYMAIPMTLLPLQDCKIPRPASPPTAHLPDIGISQAANTDNGNDIVLLFIRKMFRKIYK